MPEDRENPGGDIVEQMEAMLDHLDLSDDPDGPEGY